MQNARRGRGGGKGMSKGQAGFKMLNRGSNAPTKAHLLSALVQAHKMTIHSSGFVLTMTPLSATMLT